MAFTKWNFDNAPYLVLFELTRACALACQHCRARAIKKRNPLELQEHEISMVLEQLEEFERPLLVLTGGDPFERPDLVDIVSEARRRKIKVAITPSATNLVTEKSLNALAQSGIERLAISLDGADPASHDAFRRVEGSYEKTIQIIRWAHAAGIPIQINTSICKYNLDLFEKIYLQVKQLGAVLWSVFFLVPTGRASRGMQISADEAELVLKKMALLSASNGFDIKATAAPHFRRVLLEAGSRGGRSSSDELSSISPHMRLGDLRSYQSVNDGKGVVFISHTGEVFPSGFLPLSAGNIRESKLVDIYRESALFRDLRNPDLLKGKCGRCNFKNICGGSRARAFAETGDYLAQDSLCIYEAAEYASRS